MLKENDFRYIPDPVNVHPMGTHFQKDLDQAITIISLLSGIIGLIANSIICFLLRLMVTNPMTSTYFQNMIVANIFQGFFCLFFHIQLFIVYFKPGSDNLVFIRLMVMLHLLGYNTSFYMFTVICVSRFLTVYFSAWKQQHRLDHFAVLVCIVVWVLSILMALLEKYSCYARQEVNRHYFIFLCKALSLFSFIFELLVLMPVIVFCAVALYVKIKRLQTPPPGIDISIIATAVLFVLFDAPVRTAQDALPWTSSMKADVLLRVYMFSESLLNAAMPFVFFFVGLWKRQNKEPLFNFLKRAFKESDEEKEEDEENVDEIAEEVV